MRYLKCLSLASLFAFLSAFALADTVTFNSGVNGQSSYTESNMLIDAGGEFTHFIPDGNGGLALDLATAGHGYGIHLTDWSYFSLTSLDFPGGGDSSMTFYDGQNQVAFLHLTGLGSHFDLSNDPRFAHINYINWCGLCVTGFAFNNSIDNLTFTPANTTSVSEPGSFLLFAS